eukprot:527544_1
MSLFFGMDTNQSFQHCVQTYLNAVDTEVAYDIQSINGVYYDHIHARGLVTNFQQNRQSAKSIISSTLELLPNHEMKKIMQNRSKRQMITHYGHFRDILSAHKIRKSDNYLYINSVGATEQYNRLLTLKPRSIFDSNLINVTFIIVDCMKYNQRRCFNDLLFKRFIRHYISVTMLSTKRFSHVKDKNCPEYHKNLKCDICLSSDNIDEAFLGYLMIFCAQNIYDKLLSLSEAELAKLMVYFYKNISKNQQPTKMRIKFKAQQIKKWNIKKIIKFGKQHVISSCDYFVRTANKKCKEFRFDDNNQMFHIMGKVAAQVDKDYDLAIPYFVIAACTTNDLYERVLSLKGLVITCYLNKQYLIGLTILKCVYKLCKGYIFPSFVETQYFKQKKQFRKKVKKMECNNCCAAYKMYERKLKACTGCMEVAYCAKRCQKIHWNKTHRLQCTRKGWYQVYAMIKDTILDRM